MRAWKTGRKTSSTRPCSRSWMSTTSSLFILLRYNYCLYLSVAVHYLSTFCLFIYVFIHVCACVRIRWCAVHCGLHLQNNFNHSQPTGLSERSITNPNPDRGGLRQSARSRARTRPRLVLELVFGPQTNARGRAHTDVPVT